MPSIAVHQSLERWGAAERERGHFVIGTPEYASAEAAVTGAREAYLDAVRAIAETQGSDGIHAAAIVTATGSDYLVNRVLSAAATLQLEASEDQRASDSDQVVSDADQRDSDADMAALRDDGRRSDGDTQAQSSIRRLASSATRDRNAAARDATAGERDATLDRLDGLRRPD